MALTRTARDEPDCAKLMAGRIAVLKDARLGHADVMAIAAYAEPPPGARAFLDRFVGFVRSS